MPIFTFLENPGGCCGVVIRSISIPIIDISINILFYLSSKYKFSTYTIADGKVFAITDIINLKTAQKKK